MVFCRQRLGEVTKSKINDKPESEPLSSVKRKCRKKNGERQEKSDRAERGRIRRKKRYTKKEENILLNIFLCNVFRQLLITAQIQDNKNYYDLHF